MTFSVTTDIRASPATVWSVLRDVERWPEWTASMLSVRKVDAGPLAVGSRVRVRQPKLPPAEMRVTELEEGRSFTWVARSPGVRATARHVIEPRPDGSRVTLSIAFGGLLGPLAARLTRDLTARYVQLEADGLKARSEALERGAPSA